MIILYIVSLYVYLVSIYLNWGNSKWVEIEYATLSLLLRLFQDTNPKHTLKIY